MKIRSILGALVIAAMPFTSVWAENMTPEDIKKLVDEAVNKRMQEYEQREGTMERRESAPPAGQYPTPVGPMTDIKVERPGEEKVPLSFGATGSGRLVYAKPFVAAPKAIVGGYMDIQYRSQSKGSIENGYGGGTNGFDQQRFVPFIYADITEHVKSLLKLRLSTGLERQVTTRSAWNLPILTTSSMSP